MKLSFLDYCNLLKIKVPVDNEKLQTENFSLVAGSLVFQ